MNNCLRTPVLILVLGLFGLATVRADEPKLVSLAEARKSVDQEVRIRMQVKGAKDRLEKRGEIYLDAQEDFRDPENFAVVIDRDGAASLRAAGIEKIDEHFRDAWIEATGKVTVVQDVPRINIREAKQIRKLPADYSPDKGEKKP